MAPKNKNVNQESVSHSPSLGGGSVNYFVQFLVILLAVGCGLLINQYLLNPQSLGFPPAAKNLPQSSSPPSEESNRQMIQQIIREELANLNKMQDKIKTNTNKKEEDVVAKVKKPKSAPPKTQTQTHTTIQQDEPEMMVNLDGKKSITIDPSKLKKQAEQKKVVEVKKVETSTPKTPKTPKAQETPKPAVKKVKKKYEMSAEDKAFPSKRIAKLTPKKMWIPIPGTDGGHRRCPAIEIKPNAKHLATTKVTMYEEFLSEKETKQLIDAHDARVKKLTENQKPIACFDQGLEALQHHLVKLDRENFFEKWSADEALFTEGTTCLNQTYSRQLEKWGLKWSWSTAVYPDENRFTKYFGKLINDATGLPNSHGDKYQITSYPGQVTLTDNYCEENENRPQKSYTTFMVFLNDFSSDKDTSLGAEARFPNMDVTIKAVKGRALTWNHLNYETGECELQSTHKSVAVEHEVKKKYTISRIYFYKNFRSLGKRPNDVNEPELPRRPPQTPRVSCSVGENACRMYDEWNTNHLL